MTKVKQKIKDNLNLKNETLNSRTKWYGIVLVITLIITTLIEISEEYAFLTQNSLYTFPSVNSRLIQELILDNLCFIGLFIGIPIGLMLAYLFTILYLWFIKKVMKRNPVTFGWVRSESNISKKKTLILRAIYAGFLTMSLLFIIIENDNLASFWWKDVDTFNTIMADQSFGIYSETFLLPWLWIVLMITIALSVAAWSILDSGLISVKNVTQFNQFKRTDQVGKLLDRIIKGYIGISLIISWILWIMNVNIGIAVMPINTIIIMLFFIIILDYFKPLFKNVILTAANKVFPEISNILVDIKEVDNSNEKDK